MLKIKPYMLNAFYACINDSQLTPHILVDTTIPGVVVPVNQIEDNKIILNIRPAAIGNFAFDPRMEHLSFNTRFGGIDHRIVVPYAAVLAIYAKENGQGMIFDREETTAPTIQPESKPSHLKVVK